jgi:hypothetical protein
MKALQEAEKLIFPAFLLCFNQLGCKGKPFLQKISKNIW